MLNHKWLNKMSLKLSAEDTLVVGVTETVTSFTALAMVIIIVVLILISEYIYKWSVEKLGAYFTLNGY